MQRRNFIKKTVAASGAVVLPNGKVKIPLVNFPSWYLQISQADLDRIANVGVTGGIRNYTTQLATVSPGQSIQTAINNANGPGYILLEAGTHVITGKINMKDDIVLRGSDRENTIVLGQFYGTGNSINDMMFRFTNGTEYAGLENFTIKWDPQDANTKPYDDIRWLEENPGDTQADFDAYVKNIVDTQGINSSPYADAVPEGSTLTEAQLHVVSVMIENGANNNWVYRCNIIESGSDPIRIKGGDHNEIRECFINRAYRKDGGKAYLMIHGDDNLVIDNISMRLRHNIFADFGGSYAPTFNVFFNNLTDCDWNAHENDGGKNLCERNVFQLGGFRGNNALPFQTGSDGQHDPPGDNNWILNNIISTARGGQTIYANNEETGANEDLDVTVQNRIYEFKTGSYKHVILSDEDVPAGGLIYSPGTTIGYWTEADFATYGLQGFAYGSGNQGGAVKGSSGLLKMH